MWEQPCVHCECPVPLWGGLDFMWMPVKPSLKMPWLLFTCRGCDGEGGARAYTGYEAGLLHCSMAITALRGVFSQWGLPPNAGREALRVRLELALFLLCVFFFLPTLGFLPKKKGVLKQVKLTMLTGVQ